MPEQQQWSDEDLDNAWSSEISPAEALSASGSVIGPEAQKHREAIGAGPITMDQAKIRIGQSTAPAMDAKQRLAYEMKGSSRGRYNFLREKFGSENVVPVVDSKGSKEVVNFIVRDPGSGREMLANPTGFQAQDMAMGAQAAMDVVGTAGGGVIGAAGGPLGAMAGAGAGAAIADAAGQTIGAMLPGDEGLKTGQRAWRAGTKAAVAAGGEGIAQGLRGLWHVAPNAEGITRRAVANELAQRPSPAMREAGIKVGKEFLEEGEELTRKTGVPLSAGQLGSNTALQVESYLRANPQTAAKQLWHDANRVAYFQNGLKRQLDKLHPESQTFEEYGNRVAASYTKLHEQLASEVTEAGKLFDDAIGQSGNKAIVPTNKFKEAIAGLIKERESRGGLTHTDKSIVEGLKTKLEELGDVDNWTMREFQNALSSHGRAAAGSGEALPGIEARYQNRPASVLFGALKDTLDEVAASPGTGTGGAALKLARDKYKAAVETALEASDEVLQKALGLVEKGSPDMVVNALVGGNASPAHIKRALGLISKVDPEAADMLRRGAIEKVLRDVEPIRSELAARGAKVNPGAAAGRMFQRRAQLEALLADRPEQLEAMRQFIKVGQRLGLDPLGGSKTEGRLTMKSMFTALPFAGKSIDAASQVAAIWRADKMLEIVNDPELAKQFVRAVKPGPNDALDAARRAWTALVSEVYARDAEPKEIE